MNHTSLQPAVSLDEHLPKLDIVLLSSIARQLLRRRTVVVDGQELPVGRTGRLFLRMVSFTMNGRQYMAIEQNAAKPSYWAKLVRKGREVVQFKDVATNRFVAVVVDGVPKVYSAMRHDIKSHAHAA